MPHLKTDLQWRPMTEADLDAVAAIAVLAFPDHFEGRNLFGNRLALAAQSCFILVGGEDVVGYAIAYPWTANSAPALNTLLDAIPADAGVLYLHDLALHPDARGLGATREIVEQLALTAAADGWPAVALVAVNDAAGFWARHGFKAASPPGMAAKLASYGPDARYMVRPLRP